MDGELKGHYAGGMATQRGIDFQNRVAAWFATQALTEQSGHLDLPASPVRRIYFETSEPVADLLIRTAADGFVFIEVKHSLSLGLTDLLPVLKQFIKQWLLCATSQSGSLIPWRRPLVPERDRLLLVVSAQTPSSLRQDLAKCLSRIDAETDFATLVQAAHNQAERRSLDGFLSKLQRAFSETLSRSATDEELGTFLQLFKIKSLDIEAGHSEERVAIASLSAMSLDPNAGESIWNNLLSLCATGASDRQSQTVAQLKQNLEASGAKFSTSTRIRADIEKLRAVTRRTMRSLEHLSQLRAYPHDVSIKRLVTTIVEQRASDSSLLIIGDPGAGKSGVLFELAHRLIEEKHRDVIFLAVDRLEQSLQTDLNLENPLEEILSLWNERETGFLIVDALDAARGRSASAAVFDLLRFVVKMPSRWRVIASIRSFDLRYSPELQEIFRKDGPASGVDFENDRFHDLRHVAVPIFSSVEMDELQGVMPRVRDVISVASPEFRELLRIPFNLRLLCELLCSGLTIQELTTIHTQAALLNRYWDHRVLSPASQGALREQVLISVLETMRDNRRLSVSRTLLPTTTHWSTLSELLSSQVLVEQEENVVGRFILAFSHHLLFDYAASRLLVLSAPDGFLKKLAGEHDLALFLRPSLVLVFRELWALNRAFFWDLTKQFEQAAGIPSVARLIGPAVLAECVQQYADVSMLAEQMSGNDDSQRALAETWFLHAVGAMLADNQVRAPHAWADFVDAVSAGTPAARVLGALQALNSLLIEHPENFFTQGIVINRAACQVLTLISTNHDLKHWIRARAITDVMKVYALNPPLASETLRRLFSEDALRTTGFTDGPWIARQLRGVFSVDPQFVEDFYIAVFSYVERSEATTPMSEGQIFAMTSNKRQDYHHMWWELSQVFSEFCVAEPERGARIATAVLNSYVEIEHPLKPGAEAIEWQDDQGRLRTIWSDYSSIWDSGYRDSHEEPLQIGSTFFRQLAAMAKETPDRALALGKLVIDRAKYAVILRRLFATAIEVPGLYTQLLVPFCSSYNALISLDLSSTIGEFLKLEFATLNEPQRRTIESAIYAIPDHSPSEKRELAEHVRNRLFGCLDSSAMTTPQGLELVSQLEYEGKVPPNAPPFKMGGVYSGQYTVRDHLSSIGVDVDSPANKALFDKTEQLSGFKGVHNNETPSIEEAMEILPSLCELLASIDQWRTAGVAEQQMLHSEGVLVSVCASIAKNRSLECGSNLGHFVKQTLLRGIKSAVPEHNPAYDAQFDEHPSWGSPAQRVDAAMGLYDLAATKSFLDDSIREALKAALADLHPAVRFQAAVRLVWLHDSDRQLMWKLIEIACTSENSTGVLSGLLSYSLNQLAGLYPDQTVEQLAHVLDRFPITPEPSSVNEWTLRILVGLHIWQNHSGALALFSDLLTPSGFAPQPATQLLLDIRGLFTYRPDRGEDTGTDLRRRAFQLAERVAILAAEEMLAPEEADGEAHLKQTARTLDFISNQIYFASGAYDGKNNDHSLSEDERVVFWREAQGVIKALTSAALPSIAHHLIQTLQSFIKFDPPNVFHSIAAVVASAKRFGYQYESMAADLLVEIAELYLAQYPALLQHDEQCRRELMAILEAFVTAGWPPALRLIYRLEEMYR